MQRAINFLKLNDPGKVSCVSTKSKYPIESDSFEITDIPQIDGTIQMLIIKVNYMNLMKANPFISQNISMTNKPWFITFDARSFINDLFYIWCRQMYLFSE